MADSTKFMLLYSLVIATSLCQAQSASSKPKALLLPIFKDVSTLQYITHLSIGTPSIKEPLVLDIGGKHLWIDCDNGYQSSTYKPGYCGSASCSTAKASCVSACFTPPRPGCNNNTCKVVTWNTVWGAANGAAEIAIDTLHIQSTNGLKAGSSVSIPNFIFACSNSYALDFLASGVKGMLGLSKNQVALPKQVSSLLGGSFRRKFAICLPSNPNSKGVLFLGESPYIFHPGYNTSKTIDVSSRFMYTKLHVNFEKTASPNVQGAQMPEYFVKITSILVDRQPIPINSTLLNFHRTGIGGSQISTVQPYSILESSIYRSLVKAFDKGIATWNVTKVSAVAPFNACYTKGNLGMSLLGLSVPDITFVFENKDVYWDFYGANSMVEISHDVICLGFLDGGVDTASSIVIGAHQLQDTLLQFDLAASRMAFTPPLLLQEIECSNFNF